MLLFSNLTGRDWVALVPLVGTLSFAIYLVARTLCPGETGGDKLVNRKIKKNESKVASAVDVEDLGDKGVFCRCWKSDKFPYCDGSHVQHNKDTGDNVGPLIVNCKKKD